MTARLGVLLSLLVCASCGEVVLERDAGLGDATSPPDAAEVPTDAGWAGEDAAGDAGSTDRDTIDAGDHRDSSAGDAEDSGVLVSRVLRIVFDGSGAGSVESVPPGLVSCATDCEVSLPRGSAVEIEGVASEGSAFRGFSGAGCAGEGRCTLTLDEDAELEVRFVRRHQLSIAFSGQGFGKVEVTGAPICAGTCTSLHDEGAEVTLVATPTARATFVAWDGDCTGHDPHCTLTMGGDRSVTALWRAAWPQISGRFGSHACILSALRGLRCWGTSTSGQLGYGHSAIIGDDETAASAGDVSLAEDVVEVEAGGAHTCVLQANRRVRCWGANDHGQLGRGDTVRVGGAGDLLPNQIPEVDLGGPALQLSLGMWHSCALTADGGVRCWGRGDQGQLGYGTTQNVADGRSSLATPALAGDVDLGTPAIQISAGYQHTCALLSTGGVRCWGDNSNGQLGYPFAHNVGDGNALHPVPRFGPELTFGSGVRKVSAGGRHTCVLLESGSVRCWGAAVQGQLGNASTAQIGGAGGLPMSATSDVRLGLASVDDVIAGLEHTCAILSPMGAISGRVRCWGRGADGRLGYESEINVGDGTGADPLADVPLGDLHSPITLAAPGRNTCVAGRPFALSTLGRRVYCWGWAADGLLGGAFLPGPLTNFGHAPGTMPPPPLPVF